MLVRLAIDFENPAPTWWESGGRELWEGLSEGFEQSEVVVDEALAQSWIVQAQQIPGWQDGPDYAPHPIVAQPLEPDDPTG